MSDLKRISRRTFNRASYLLPSVESIVDVLDGDRLLSISIPDANDNIVSVVFEATTKGNWALKNELVVECNKHQEIHIHCPSCGFGTIHKVNKEATKIKCAICKNIQTIEL